MRVVSPTFIFCLSLALISDVALAQGQYEEPLQSQIKVAADDPYAASDAPSEVVQASTFGGSRYGTPSTSSSSTSNSASSALERNRSKFDLRPLDRLGHDQSHVATHAGEARQRHV